MRASIILDNTCIEKLVHVFIYLYSRLAYFNSILYGCPSYEIQYHHISLILKEVHWLSVEERIIFKNLLLAKKIVSNEAVLYLSDLIVIYVPGSTNLRSP